MANVVSSSVETIGISENFSTVAPTEDPREEWFKGVITAIRWCFLPIVAVGTATNLLNVIVFSSRRMLHLSTVNMLLALAIADFGILYFEVCGLFVDFSTMIFRDFFPTTAQSVGPLWHTHAQPGKSFDIHKKEVYARA